MPPAGRRCGAAALPRAKGGSTLAPVLARIFIPLFALVLLAFLVTMVATGRGLDVEREILIAVEPFTILEGFRDTGVSAEVFAHLGPQVAQAADALRAGDLPGCIRGLLTLPMDVVVDTAPALPAAMAAAGREVVRIVCSPAEEIWKYHGGESDYRAELGI